MYLSDWPQCSSSHQLSREVHVALHDKLKQELDRMESSQIITKVTEPQNSMGQLISCHHQSVVEEAKDTFGPHGAQQGKSETILHYENVRWYLSTDFRS